MVDATQTFKPGVESEGEGLEARVLEERKRYTTQLQRRAQAHVTAEFGAGAVEEDTDRQVTMLVQHALETTGARRVSLLRPVPRGRRWHVATVLDDGCFYYGLVAPETLALSIAACERRSPVMLSADYPADPALPRPSEMGFKSYLGVPIVVSGTAIAVVEAVDVAQPDNLERYAVSLEKAVAALADRLATEALRDGWQRTTDSDKELNEQSVFDLVLRPPVDNDDAIEISPPEWAILHQLNGERALGTVAQVAGMPIGQVCSLAASLLERGLIRAGRENRRRG